MLIKGPQHTQRHEELQVLVQPSQSVCALLVFVQHQQSACGSLRRNIKIGHFKQAIQDYKMARTLFKETKINVFREVCIFNLVHIFIVSNLLQILEEVENIVAQMKSDQYRKLEGLQGNIEVLL